MQPFMDAHLHLQDKRFTDIAAVVKRAVDAGVERIVCNATCEADWQVVLDLESVYPQVTPYIGIHPWQADSTTLGWEQRLSTLARTNVTGIGEAGLDKHCRVKMNQQEDVFIFQLQLAADLGRPLVIHCIGCWGRLLDILESYGAKSLPLIMLHSYSGSIETMQRLIRLGCFFSFSLALADQKRQKIRAAFLAAPLDNILLETDAPDQRSEFLTGKSNSDNQINEPAYITELYDFAARLRNIPLDKFCQQIWNNGTIFTNLKITG